MEVVKLIPHVTMARTSFRGSKIPLSGGQYFVNRHSSINHPIYIDLKEKLQSVSGQSKEDRQLIPKTAHELLELYWAR